MRRAECGYKPENVRFLLECDFSKQYSNYYRTRLQNSKTYLEANARSKWDPSIPIYSLVQLASAASQQDDFAETDSNSELCIIIGTIFKRNKIQSDILEDLTHGGFNIKCERYIGSYVSQDDKIILEDSDESISLIGKIDAGKLVTGVTVALLGQAIDDCGKFLVRDMCFAEPNRMLLYEPETLTQSVRFERSLDESDTRPLYLMVLSGLEFHHDMEKSATTTQALQNIIDFIWGGGKYSEDERCPRVVRILVVGNNLSEDRLTFTSPSQAVDIDPTLKLKRSRQVKPYTSSIMATHHLDDFFAELSKTINVDVMPGPSDPASHLMPQQPFHPCIFPKSCIYPTFNCVTNPHRATYNGHVDILATSGQTIDIVDKFSDISDPISIMKTQLMWGNMAPSAPDNLYSAPCEDDDPMVIDYIPEIYIAGCQDYYRRSRYRYDSCKPSNEFANLSAATSSNPNETTLQSNESSSLASQRLMMQKSFSSGSIKDTSQVSRSALDNSNSDLSSLFDNNRGGIDTAAQKTSTILITVPKFSETYSCVLINLKTLKSDLVSFS